MNLDKLSKPEMSNSTSLESSLFDPDNRIELNDTDPEEFTDDKPDLNEESGNSDPDKRIKSDDIDKDNHLDSVIDSDCLNNMETGGNEFNPNNRIDTKNKVYYDDNEKQYREGDKLLPNNSYELNGYAYETDKKGRIVSAGGKLRIVDSTSRNMERDINTVGKGYEKENDNKGHVIGHQFGGDDRLGNLIAQDKKENQGEYSRLENKLADAVKEGKNVTVDIKIDYLQGSYRPSKIVYTYSIDGKVSQQTFKNRSSK